MKFTDSTYANALTLGYNLVQIKYSGESVRAEVSRGQGRIYALRDGAHLGDFTLDDGPVCTLLGSWYQHHPDRPLIVWDCTSVGEQPEDYVRLEHTDLRNYTYRDRFALARERVGEMKNVTGTAVSLVQNYRIAEASTVWASLPDLNTHLKVVGLVYRKSTGTFNDPVLLSRWYHDQPSGLP